MLVFVYEAKGGDLALNNVPAEDSYIQVNEGVVTKASSI